VKLSFPLDFVKSIRKKKKKLLYKRERKYFWGTHTTELRQNLGLARSFILNLRLTYLLIIT
jgi:hypothetical protein